MVIVRDVAGHPDRDSVPVLLHERIDPELCGMDRLKTQKRIGRGAAIKSATAWGRVIMGP